MIFYSKFGKSDITSYLFFKKEGSGDIWNLTRKNIFIENIIGKTEAGMKTKAEMKTEIFHEQKKLHIYLFKNSQIGSGLNGMLQSR